MVINFCIMPGRMKKILIAAVLGICLVSTVSADLTGRIDAIIGRSSQKKVRFSVHIVRADSGRAVFSHNPGRVLIPASNMKIITTAAALKFLGPNYKYRTQVSLCGDTLVVTGSGDPLLGDRVTDAKYGRKAGWVFENIAAALKQKHIKAINDIIVDSSIFDDQRVHPNWPKEQLNRWYACEVSGVNFSGNCVDITAKAAGNNVRILVEPQTSFVKVINKVKSIRKGKSAIGTYRQAQANKIVVHGKCKRQDGPFAVAIERPAAFFGFLLAENLTRAGIAVKGQLIEKPLSRNCSPVQIAEFGNSITDCLARCNKDSFQLAAEALFKTIAANANKDNKNGSWAQGREIISQYLLELGIEPDRFYIDDASGLSRQDKLSANAITKVLLDVYKSRDWHLFKDSLAVGGVDGTIAKHFKEAKYRGRVFGKTGYIKGVKSFSGLCTTAKGDYIFSILANNANGRTRTAINDIAKAIIDSAD